MALYRHREKGWIFEAEQWYALLERDDVVSLTRTTGMLKTDHGNVSVKTGDWLIESPDGDTYKVSDQQFRSQFERQDGSPTPHLSRTEREWLGEREKGNAALQMEVVQEDGGESDGESQGDS